MTAIAIRPSAPLDVYDLPVSEDLDWFGLYKGAAASKDPELFTPQATRHPAKMSLHLLRRILDHMQSEGWLKTGDCVVDPFGGRAATGLEWCKRNSRNASICVDVERHFVEMGQACRELASQTYPWIAGNLLIREYDSRQIDELLSGWLTVGDPCAISSPPYGKGVIGSCSPAQLERLKRLTQDSTSSLYGRDPEGEWFQAMAQGYINSEGNIDRLPVDGDYANLSSPPYAATRSEPQYSDERLQKAAGPCVGRLCSAAGQRTNGYGAAEGQIGALRDGTDYAALTSPPYESSLSGDDPDKRGGLFRDPKRRNDASLTANYQAVSSPPFEAQSGGNPEIKSGPLADPRLHERHAAARVGKSGGYADNSEGQIGTKRGETYASACGQVYAALARSGVRYVALVTKNPVSKGELKRLDLLTIRLMEEAGYSLIDRKRAWLWETRAQMLARGETPPPLEKVAAKTRAAYAGREDQIPHGRLTFFHMLHMLKGRRPPAQWEDILFFSLEAN